jgi:filamentous hemagglutinin family protein
MRANFFRRLNFMERCGFLRSPRLIRTAYRWLPRSLFSLFKNFHNFGFVSDFGFRISDFRLGLALCGFLRSPRLIRTAYRWLPRSPFLPFKNLYNFGFVSDFGFRISDFPLGVVLLLTCISVHANPLGGTVAQGSASFTSQGSRLTINAADHTFINWNSFNIRRGETTTFVQPSSSSLVWNQINDPNPSQILGNLNANGYVVLQNQAGFFIGGQASITTHGLLMTTAPIPMPDLAGDGAWQFSAPPPAAKIINYGQISTDPGGSLFLIAHDIENHGTMSANQGTLGLYAGKDVLVSTRPDGRGLSAKVTLPEGSVDNSGKLIADAGTIALHAQVVNQGGLIQANSVRQVNGHIQLVASDSVNLGAGSVISAQGDSQGVSSGGSVLIKSDTTFADQPGSTIQIGGGQNGGNGGQVEISAPQMSSIQSSIDGSAAPGFTGGQLLIDPANIILATSGSAAPGSGTVNPGDPPTTGTLTLNINSFSKTLSQITLQATGDIELSGNTTWSLQDPGVAATLSLIAGNSIRLDDGSAIKAGKNWSLNLAAGTQLAAGARPTPGKDPNDSTVGNDGIYLKGSSVLQSQDGNINLFAPNEVIVNGGAIRTLAGGNLNVTTVFGDVNSGVNINGYTFGLNVNNNVLQNYPFFQYYKVNSANLGGISTAAGGNVTITAGGNVISYNPTQNDFDNNSSRYDAGTGAFGPAAGNVTITAGGNVYGHYVVANGVGTIRAGGDIGVPLVGTQSKGFSLSLIAGSWNVLAPNGNIYLQDVRNPNGIFNDKVFSGYAGYHYFDYDPYASVSLEAGNSVEITGGGIPHTAPSNSSTPIPLLFPPTLSVLTGAGGFVLDTSVILLPSLLFAPPPATFSSPAGDLSIITLSGGNFVGVPDFNGVTPILEMSDSASRNWAGSDSFNLKDHAPSPPEWNSQNPVQIAVSGSMKSVDLYTTKATKVTVLGDMINSGFVGENLHANDATTLNVHGQIYNTPGYAFVTLDNPLVGANALQPGAWQSVFSLAVDPAVASVNISSIQNLNQYITSHKLFTDASTFVYLPSSQQLGIRGPMSSSLLSALSTPLTVLVVDAQGNPIITPGGHILTTQYTFAPSSKLSDLWTASQIIPKDPPPGYQIGGPGKFVINAGSIDLGNTLGILSWGIGGPLGDNRRYAALAGSAQSGAEIDVNVTGDLTMLTSTIASMYGGDVNVKSTGGSLDLGSQDLLGTSRFAFGIYTSGHSDVNVEAAGDVNINGSRIAAYNGGNVSVKSDHGDVNAGSGGFVYVNVQLVSRDPTTGESVTKEDPIYGSGIVAVSLPTQFQTPGGNPLPGNITVLTPEGDIVSSQAGILQLALDGNIAGGPTVTLQAGTPPADGLPGHAGNIDLGNSGVIGGTVNLTAQGNIQGLVVSRQSSTINAAQNFSGTLLSAGTANVSAGGSVSGTVIGVGGANVSGGGGISANVLSQNASVNGAAAQSTLGTTAAATSTSQAAAQQANTQTQQQVANENPDEKDKNKKKGPLPVLVRRVGRVTVILPPNS